MGKENIRTLVLGKNLENLFVYICKNTEGGYIGKTFVN